MTSTAASAGRRGRKPPTKGQLRRMAWRTGFTRAIVEFGRHGCTDLAAGLTYFAILAIFPAILALVALLGVLSDGPATTKALVDLADQFGSGAGDTLKPIIRQLTESQGAGWTLVAGIVGALWSASAYVRAFSRAMNRIYQVPEGRSVVKLRVTMYLLTFVMVIGAAFVIFGAVMSGPVARNIGDLVGLGQASVETWNIVKWPVILIVVILMVALLYYATPNVKQPKFRWLSLGAAIAILVWILISVGFGFYVSNFGSYNRTYGSLAGVIVFLLWLWLTNIAMLFGGVVDAEVERALQLQDGVKAEKQLQLPQRDSAVSDKKAKQYRAVVGASRKLRQDADTRARARSPRRALDEVGS